MVNAAEPRRPWSSLTRDEKDAFLDRPGTGDRGNHATTEISEQIDAFRAGLLGEEALVDFLDTFQYGSAEGPDAPERGSSEWHPYHVDGGKPYVVSTPAQP